MKKFLLISCLSTFLINAMEESQLDQVSVVAVQARKLRAEASEFVPQKLFIQGDSTSAQDDSAVSVQDTRTLAQRRGVVIKPVRIPKDKSLLRPVVFNQVWWQVTPGFYHNDPFRNQLIASQLFTLQSEFQRNGTLVCCMFGCSNKFYHLLIDHFLELKEYFENQPLG
jgi:hypothetical protein